MNKDEFIQGLREALSGEVPPAVMMENQRYYENYIRTEMEKGRMESEIMEELGSPRLIARTIIDTTPGAGEGAYEEYGGENSQSQPRSQSQGGSFRYYDLNKWYWKLLALLGVIVVLAVVLMVIGGILSLVIPLLPAIGLVILIMWFVRGSSGPGGK